MKLIRNSRVCALITVLCLPAFVAKTSFDAVAQQPAKPQADDVLRVNTDLVQTAITVVDKNGRFVEDLEAAQFELLVDGVRRPITFFERVKAGSARELELVKPAQAEALTGPAPKTPPSVRGRTIVFFIDDLHLSAESMNRTRDMLKRFIESDMAPGDWVAIASASGQIGFLQQFTNIKEILSAAVERLVARPYEVRSFGSGSTKMSEFDALQISTSGSAKNTSAVLNFYIRECIVQNTIPNAKMVPEARAAIAAMCENDAKNSARAVLMQAAAITQNTYASFDSLLSSSARAPGRKLTFFISDGFLLDAGPNAADLRGRLESIIDRARRAGVVVYTIDGRGLITTRVELTQSNARTDVGAPIGDIQSQQDAMNALAEDTGGRALRNTNYFDRWIAKVLDETSNYYLLAWRPDKEVEKVQKFRNVKVVIAGRPDLTVRAPRGYVEGPQPETIVAANSAVEKPAADKGIKPGEADFRDALADYYPRQGLPTLLSLTYLNTPKNGLVVTSSLQIATRGLSYGDDGKRPATITLMGVILNDKGKIAGSFKNQLNVDPPSGKQSETAGVIYNQKVSLAPGIYQVRVAVRDEKSRRVGSALQWIVIPDLTAHRLTLSSLLLGGQVLENSKSTDAAPQVQLSVDHTFPRSARLGYWVFVYNAKRDPAGAANLTAQTAIIRDGQVVLMSPQRKLGTGAPDPERIPFGDELSLQTLTPGKYDLRVTITDSVGGTSATQTIDFVVLGSSGS